MTVNIYLGEFKMTEPKRYTIETVPARGSIFSIKTGGVPDKDGQWIFDPDHKIDLAVDMFDRYILQNKVLEIRDDLEPIMGGKIKKGRNASRYSIGPEYRKTTLKDAREIIKYVQQKLNLIAEDIFPRIQKFKK